jgi:hypothetical protein
MNTKNKEFINFLKSEARHYWRVSDLEKERLERYIVEVAAEMYGFRAKYYYVPDDVIGYAMTGGGCVRIHRNGLRVVTLFKHSMMTLLHEIAHCFGLDQEEAIEWSHRIFKNAFPKTYKRAVEKGLFLSYPKTTEENEHV